MKAKLFTTFLFVLTCLSLSLAQDRLQFGLRSNIGVFGLTHPKGYDIEDKVLGRVDGFYKYPKLAFSLEVLTEYTFMRAGDWSMALQLGLGYNYISFRKEWHFERGYDADFINYTSEQQIIHELEALYLTLPLRGSLKFRKFKGSLGLSGSRVFFASIDRTFRSRSGSPLGEWYMEKKHWRAFKKQKDYNEINTPYLSHLFSLQGIISLEYQITKKLFIGIENRRFYYLPSLHVHFDTNNDGAFFYNGKMWSLSVLFIH